MRVTGIRACRSTQTNSPTACTIRAVTVSGCAHTAMPRFARQSQAIKVTLSPAMQFLGDAERRAGQAAERFHCGQRRGQQDLARALQTRRLRQPAGARSAPPTTAFIDKLLLTDTSRWADVAMLPGSPDATAAWHAAARLCAMHSAAQHFDARSHSLAPASCRPFLAHVASPLLSDHFWQQIGVAAGVCDALLVARTPCAGRPAARAGAASEKRP